MAKTNGSDQVAETVVMPSWDSDELRGIQSFEQALAMAQEAFGDVVMADEEIGTGFAILNREEKMRLVGVPCLFLSWRFSLGDMGQFVSAMVVAKGGGKYIVNDGSTGIHQQLWEYSEKTNRHGGLLSHKGLRVSEYTYTNDKGEESPAKTFYIDAAAL